MRTETSRKRGVRLMAAAWVMLLVLQACAQEPDTDPTPGATGTESPSPSPDSTALGQECFSPRGGYEVQYPDDWHVNDPEGADPCAWFHPEPFTLPVASEATDIAIRISVDELGFDQMSDAITSGPNVKEVASTEETEIAGRRALRVEVVESGEALYPEDARQTIYAVEWDEEATLTATTADVAAGDYTSHVEVLDEMVQTLEAYDSEVACSAAVLDPDAPDQEGLPEEVAATRAAILEAAVACDYDALAELAQQGDEDFTFSFGGGDDPAEYWREQEADELGPDPMRYLAGLLKRPYESLEVEGGVQYLWPAAFASEWDAVPDEQKEALRPLYNELNFSDFERFGGYLGYRVGISESGEWLFFVAGD